MGKEIKTIEQWLNELPEPYKTQAIENTISLSTKSRLKIPESSLKEALGYSFVWSDSSQGHEYWLNLYNTL